MPSQQGGLPVVWDDSASPAFANGVGASAPTLNDFVGAGNGVVRLLQFTLSQEDRVHNVTQILHDILVPSSGNVEFRPHVHMTFPTNPAVGGTVVWTLSYVYARGGTTALTAGKFQSSVAEVSGTYNTTADDESLSHLIVPLNSATVSIPAADCGPSMIFLGTLRVRSTSTSGVNPMFLSFDWHYQKLPVGTVGEFT